MVRISEKLFAGRKLFATATKFSIILLLLAGTRGCFPAENALPDILFLYPIANDYIQVGDTVKINVDVADPDGHIAEFWILIDSTEIYRTNDQRFSYAWNTGGWEPGKHNILAGASDNEDGKMTVSIPVYLVDDK